MKQHSGLFAAHLKCEIHRSVGSFFELSLSRSVASNVYWRVPLDPTNNTHSLLLVFALGITICSA